MLFKMSAQDFELIYEKYKNLLFRIAFTMLKNCEDAEDVLQEVFIKRVYHAPIFETDEHEKRWLIRVTVNMCKNHLMSFWYRNRTEIAQMLGSRESTVKMRLKKGRELLKLKMEE